MNYTYEISPGIRVTKEVYERHLRDVQAMLNIRNDLQPPREICYDPYPEEFEQPRDPEPPAECQIYSEAYTPHL